MLLSLAAMAVTREENPFVPGFGVIPPALAGREPEFADLESAVRRVRGGYYEQPRLLSGDRGLGKTAVLAELLTSARADGCWVVDVEAGAHTDVIVPLLRELHRALMEHDLDARVGEYTRQALAILTAFGLKHRELELSIDITADRMRGGTGDLATDLADALVAAAVAAAHLGTAILLSVDEVHALPADQMGPLFAALQRVARHETRPGSVLPVLTVVAGLPHARAAMRAASSTYAERIREHELGLLSDAAAAEALTIPTTERGAPLTGEALQLLLPAIGGYPYFLQLFGYETWNAAADRKAETLDAAAAEEGVASGRREAGRVYASRLAELPEGERRYLQAVANTPADGRTSSAIAAAMDDPASKWGWARARLIDRGLLRPDGYGRVAFALPGLEEHLAGSHSTAG